MTNVIFVSGNKPRCVDEDTEYLSRSGWRKIKDYNIGDEVLVSNPVTGVAHFEVPADYINGGPAEFLQVKSQTLDLCVTPDHKFLGVTAKGCPKSFYAKDLFQSLNSKSGKDLRVKSTFKIENKEYPISDDLLRLWVAINADATLRYSSTGYTTSNLKKERKKVRLRDLLNRCSVTFKEINYKGMQGYSSFSFYSPVLKGFDRDVFYNLSIRQCKIVRDEMILWDGSITKTGTPKFFTCIKEEADLFQYLSCMVGEACTISEDIRSGRNTTYNCSVYRGRDYVSFATGRLRGKVTTSIKDRHYCFTTSTGAWVSRKNNKVIITGNSGKGTTGKFIKNLLEGEGYSVEIMEFKDKLFEISADTLGISVEEFLHLYDRKVSSLTYLEGLEIANSDFSLPNSEWVKDYKMYEVNGKWYSKREWLIFISENIIKKHTTDTYFGDSVTARIDDQDFVVITDSGFVSEALPVMQKVGKDNCLVIQLVKKDASTVKDSRKMLEPEDFNYEVDFIRIENNGTLEGLRKSVEEGVSRWVSNF